jgi:DNA polymerase/3'-5' exonuclease PolX
MQVFGVDALRFLEDEKIKDDTWKEGDKVPLDSEEDIFRFLRMKYIPPQNRSWF